MKIKYILMAAAAALTFSSCNDLLNIPQHGVQSYENYYQTDEEAESAIINCYITLKGLEYNYFLGKNFLTDDFWAGGGVRNDNAQLEELNEFSFSAEQDMLQGMFQSYYGLIYDANVVLGHVNGDSAVMQRARAEARVFRAWAYFELISMWGNPPLVDHELEPSEYNVPNGDTEELWAFVENDLNEAIGSGYLSEKSNVNDKVWRVTKQFAQALLGKAYLWQEKYAESAKIFDEIVESKLYKLWEDYENINSFYGKQNPESIFESVKISDANNVWNNASMKGVMLHYRTDRMSITGGGLATTGWGFGNPQKSLYDDFVAVEGEDGYRLNCTIKTYQQMVDMGNTILTGNQLYGHEGYFMWKWRVVAEQLPAMGYNFVDDNNSYWMRYAEVLLCAAEAHFMNGNTGKAVEYMNQIRERAQAPLVSSVTLEDIQREKRIELCGESLRFQDIIRWGLGEKLLSTQGASIPSTDSNGNVTYQQYNTDPARYGFKEKHYHLPIPAVEIRLNNQIEQNPGW